MGKTLNVDDKLSTLGAFYATLGVTSKHHNKSKAANLSPRQVPNLSKGKGLPCLI